MPEFHLQKIKRGLAPADEKAFDVVRMMAQGKVIKVKYSFPRNYKNHQRFFSFIGTTFDIQDHFDNRRIFRRWLIGKAGYFTIVEYPNGKTVFEPDSISFDNMEEPEFREVFTACIDAFLKQFGDKISRNELYQVIDFI